MSERASDTIDIVKARGSNTNTYFTCCTRENNSKQGFRSHNGNVHRSSFRVQIFLIF